jgi:hypothetical protein
MAKKHKLKKNFKMTLFTKRQTKIFEKKNFMTSINSKLLLRYLLIDHLF